MLSLEFARGSLASVLNRVRHDVHPPLYFLVLHPFVKLGIGEKVLRFPSLLFGTLTLPLLFLIGRELYGKWQGLTAMLLLCLSPFHLFYSQEARMYSLLLFWICLSSWLLLVALRTGRRRFWVAYSAVAALSLYTHYFTVFLLGAQNLYLFAHGLRAGFRREYLFHWAGSQFLILLFYAPWIPVLVAQYRTGKGSWITQYFGYPGLEAVADTIRVFGTGPARLRHHLADPSYLFLALALAGLVFRNREKPVAGSLFAGIMCFAPFFVVFLASQIQPAYQIKYLIGIYPFYLLLVIGGISLFPWSWARIAVVSVLLLSLAVPVYTHYGVTRNAPWRDVTQVVLMESGPEDVVGFNAGYIDRLFRYYRDLNFPGKEFESYRFPYLKQGDKDLPKLDKGLRKIRRQYRRLWLIQSHYWDSDPHQLVRRRLMERFPLLARRGGDPELYLFQLK